MALYKWSIRLAGIGSFPDQIQYMSQDDYNALSEEAKMNGTTYGIVGASADPYKESLDRVLQWWWESDTWDFWNISIPDWCNIVYIRCTWWYSYDNNFWWAPWVILTRWLPGTQYLEMCYDTNSKRVQIDVDWDAWSITLTNVAWRYDNITIRDKVITFF